MSDEDRLQFEAELRRLAAEARRLDSETALDRMKTVLAPMTVGAAFATALGGLIALFMGS